MINAAMSDLFFNTDKPILDIHFAEHGHIDYSVDSTRLVLQEEAESFLSLLEMATGYIPDFDAIELANDFINRL